MNHTDTAQNYEIENWKLPVDSPASKKAEAEELKKIKYNFQQKKELAQDILTHGLQGITPQNFFNITESPFLAYHTDHWNKTELKGQAGKNWISDHLKYWELIIEREEYFLTHIHPETTEKHIETGLILNELTEKMKRNRQQAFYKEIRN